MANVIIGIDMGGTKILGGIFTPNGEALHTIKAPTYPTSDSDPYHELEQVIHHLIAFADSKAATVKGIGVGVPGVVENSAVVSLGVALKWNNFPLKERLSQTFPYPIMVENDANIAALGEYHYGAAQKTRSMICIAIGTGIGAGIVLDGKLYTGAGNVAGEVGYFISDHEQLNQRYDGFGALETVASGTGIAQQAQKHTEKPYTAQDVFIAMRKNQTWAHTLLSDVADHISIMIANVTMLLNPDCIVLSGSVMTEADFFLPIIHQRLDGRIPIKPDIRVSTLGAHAALLGAISYFK